MAYLTWRETYGIGITAIDNQHKQLIKIINDLFEAHHAGMGKEVIGKTLSDVIDYTHYHFDCEEDMMKQCGYSELTNHLKEHKDFRDQINKFSAEANKGNLILSIKTIDYLKDWTINHILGTDKEFGEFLLKKEIGQD